MAGEALVGQVVGFSQVSETAGFREAHMRTKRWSVKDRVLGGDTPARLWNAGNRRSVEQKVRWRSGKQEKL